MSTLTQLKIEAYKTSRFNRSDLIQGATFVGDFNPADYTLTRSNKYNATPTPGTSRPESTFAYGNNDKLSVAFTFDGTGVNGTPGSVMERVQLFLSLLKYRGDIHKPAYARVIWGDFTFQGVLISATAKFVLFDRSGSPLRAKLDASFEEVLSETDRISHEKKSSPDVDRVWVVELGDRIDRIAYASYGNSAYWWQLAKANQLSNPRDLTPGKVLRLPRLVQ